jgi:hypothetical protein
VIIEAGLVKAGLVKTSLSQAIQQIRQRYFRRNEGTTDYATIPRVVINSDFMVSVSGIFNTGAVLGDSSTSSAGLYVQGLADSKIIFRISGNDYLSTKIVNDGMYHTIDVKRLGSTIYITIDGVLDSTHIASTDTFRINQIYRIKTGSFEEFGGILANLKIYDNGTLVRNYPLDDNSSTLRERVSGQDGSIVNSTADQWVLFQKQATGEWLGQELVVNGGFDTDSDWVEGVGWDIAGGRATFSGSSQTSIDQSFPFYVGSKYSYSISAVIDAADVFAQFGGGQIIISSTQTKTGIITTSIPGIFKAYAGGGGTFRGSLDNVSVKEVLNVA